MIFVVPVGGIVQIADRTAGPEFFAAKTRRNRLGCPVGLKWRKPLAQRRTLLSGGDRGLDLAVQRL